MTSATRTECRNRRLKWKNIRFGSTPFLSDSFLSFFLHNNTYLSLILLLNSEIVDNSKKTEHLCICNKKVRNILRSFFFLIFLCAAYMSIAIRKQIYTSSATRKQKAVIRMLEHSNNFSTNRKIYCETKSISQFLLD